MALEHFTNVRQEELFDPIYKNLAYVKFFEKSTEHQQNIEIPILTEQIYKIEGNLMYFNFNWELTKKNLVPLSKIVELMNNSIPMFVIVEFHDREGRNMYISNLDGFKFKKVVNNLDFDYYKETDIKDLIVEFEYSRQDIITSDFNWKQQ